MKSCENMIVSIQIGRELIDMELPAFMPVGELSRKVAQTLNYMDPVKYAGLNALALYLDETRLPEQKTLAGCGIWDGRILRAKKV